MKATFVAMGSENITFEALGAYIKARGHEAEIVYDQALFDDKNYLTMPWLARLLDNPEKLARRVLDTSPDIVGFTVFTCTYQWALKIASLIKKESKVPIIFGGIHPTSLPEKVINNPHVDMVCVGDGEEALAELLDAMELGEDHTEIQNLWLKNNGAVQCNNMRKLMVDIDSYPLPDKSLFEASVPIPFYYLAVTSRGCPYACAFCSLSRLALQAVELGASPLRERSVESVICELKAMKARYNYEWVDVKNNTFTANRSWTLNFLKRYRNEIDVPLRVFAHPLKMDEELAQALKDAGCWRVQMGVESFSEKLRREVLNRHESNEDIEKACKAMDKVGLSYSLDYILGLPGQTEEELHEAALFFTELKHCVRITPFWIEYLPATPLVETAYKMNAIGDEGIKRIEEGLDSHYVAQGSITDKKVISKLKAYQLLYRMTPTTPKPLLRYIVKKRLYKIFPYMPVGPIIFIMDFFMSYKIKDLSATTYIKSYFWFFRKRIREALGREV